jgi:hypothetical protein
MPCSDDKGPYHAGRAYVEVGSSWAFTEGEIWDAVDHAESVGIPLGEIGRALASNWTAAVIALTLHNIATLRTLIGEARPS